MICTHTPLFGAYLENYILCISLYQYNKLQDTGYTLTPDHDFLCMFNYILRCKTGRHTTEKPLTAPSLNAQKPTPSVFPKKITAGSCLRCQQGFFCSDHGKWFLHFILQYHS